MAIMTGLLTQIRDDVKTALGTALQYAGVGEDTTTATAGDTELGLEVFRNARDDFDDSVVDEITASLRITANEANNNEISEAGWFDAGSLLVDGCDAADWTDSADMTTSVNSSEYKENDAALDLTKDAGASAIAYTYKTTTSRDFTSKSLAIWLYIIDATALAKLAASDCLVIRFGSDSSNYYEWTKDSGDLSVGWNLIKNLTSANADSTTGSPSLTAMDYTYVALEADAAATTWSAGDFIMDYIVLTSGTMYLRNNLTSITKTDDIQLYLDDTIIVSVEEVL